MSAPSTSRAPPPKAVSAGCANSISSDSSAATEGESRPSLGATAALLRGHGGTMSQMLSRLFRQDAGVTALEYALIAALIALVIIGGVSLLGTDVSKVFSTVANTI